MYNYQPPPKDITEEINADTMNLRTWQGIIERIKEAADKGSNTVGIGSMSPEHKEELMSRGFYVKNGWTSW